MRWDDHEDFETKYKCIKGSFKKGKNAISDDELN